MSAFKIDTLKHIEKQKLFDLIINIIGKLGYNNIRQEGDLIIGNYSGPLSQHNHGFIYLDEKLNSSKEINQYEKVIKGDAQKYEIGTFFVFSNNTITKGFQSGLKSKIQNLTLDFIGRDDLIVLIDKHLIDFWRHDDAKLLSYEKFYCDAIYGENDLKKLQIFNEKYERLLQIFIEPNYYHFHEDKATGTPVRKKVSMEQLTESTKPIILSGNAGTGKTTSLKRIGENLISLNKNSKAKKNLPLFLGITELFDFDYKIEKLIKDKLKPYFADGDDIYGQYQITLLIDSIDELEESNQNTVLEQLMKLQKNKNVNFIIASRNSEKLFSNPIIKGVSNYSIEKFNDEQIKRFISSFFQNEHNRAESLLDALKDNRILEKLPITPLTLSLISILYEENNLEIPATITDIYDNFNSVLLGKAVVSSRLEFIDSSFRERILSLYGLALLERKEHAPMDKEEFFDFFVKYYENKTIPIRKGGIKDVLEYLLNNTGILFLKDGKYIQFSHDSFMEYYAAIEIFKHQREKESLMIDSFLEIHWQNTAFFYAGKSKDMSGFLEKIIERTNKASKLSDFFIGVMGLGYLMQALYQTDNKLRKLGVDSAINLNIQAHETILKISGEHEFLYKNYKLPILLLMNAFYFYENFNSITLKEPLKLSFNDFYTSYLNSSNTNDGYKSLKTALTLNSKRINDVEPLEKLIFESKLIHDPNLLILTNIAVDMDKTKNYKEIKKEIKKDFHKLAEPLKKLAEIPANRLRFSNYDSIQSNKKITIITEGITDTQILEHAYMVLTNGNLPYWRIKPAGVESGGVKELSKTLQSLMPIIEKDQKIIGIFDRDSAGIQEFNSLKGFESLENHTVKKHPKCEIYAILLPAISSRENYIQSKQDFNFLEIEHYFSDELLSSHNKLKETPIKGIFEIRGSKQSFAKEVIKIQEPEKFQNFLEIFERIDKISGVQVDYLN
ncbi:NACHT domain-containing protein [Pedobacter sp. SG908]|uniref:NACHT domain-containing protein n=1 Tax=Pedobacter sp. SG908 TaxID=2587135 RepID=UPI001421BFB3|nr:NACHT domain-containing protein [Pedobacter sp. SG908]NII81206.1 DNA polymerase III delta prime subunit [Pedobacter sp. SG908]